MRYIVLVLLITPIVLLALVNIITQYKMKRASKARLKHQLVLWVVLFVVLLCSFPIYNYLSGRPILDSHELSVFDIVQTTAIILLVYIINYQRQKIEYNDTRLRQLHQKLSIRLSEKDNGRK